MNRLSSRGGEKPTQLTEGENTNHVTTEVTTLDVSLEPMPLPAVYQTRETTPHRLLATPLESSEGPQTEVPNNSEHCPQLFHVKPTQLVDPLLQPQ